MTCRRSTTRFRLLSVWFLTLSIVSSTTNADIFRWDNGQLIRSTEGITPGPGVQLDNQQLEYASLSQFNLNGAKFSHSNLTRASFFRSNVAYADLQETNLTSAEFTRSTLTGANLAGANLTNARLDFTELSGANIAGATVTATNFRSSSLSKEQLYSTASYQQRNLQGTKFGHELPCCGAPNDLTGWDLSGQNLTNVTFGFTNLTKINLAGSDLTNAYFLGATMTGANLANANLTNVRSLGSLTFNTTILAMLDLRGAQYDDVVIERAVMRNSIDRNGQIVGLNMTADNSLVVRDDDGVVAPPPNIWLTPRPPIAVTVRDHFVMSSGSVLQLVFESDLWDSLISFQPAIPVDLGGILDLGFAPVVDIRSQIGRTIRLFDWTGVTPTGAFAIRSPYLWDTSQLYTTGEVTLLAIPEPASIVIVSTGIFGALVLRLRNPLFWTE